MSTQTYKPISIASSTRELYQKAKEGIPPLDTKTDIKAYFHLAANLYNKVKQIHIFIAFPFYSDINLLFEGSTFP